MNKEQKVAIIAAMLPILVFGGSFIQVYMSHQEHEAVFKVFEANHMEGKSGTQVLTWGEGKFFFIGNWTGQFYEGHTYRVTYVRQPGMSKHILTIVEWEEII